jgi:Xaa-Pro aminopeptidase
MIDIFTSDFFVNNRQKLRQSGEVNLPIVIAANGVQQRNADNTYPFKQDSSFWYLTGLTEPDLVLVMTDSEEYLIMPQRSEIHGRFEGIIDPEELRRVSGISDIYDTISGWRELRIILRQKKCVSTLLPSPAYIESWGMYTNPARQRLVRRLKGIQTGLQITDIRMVVARMRQVKQAPELIAIQKAIDITVETMQTVLSPKQWASYQYEYEVEADLLGGYRRRGAESLAFTPIVGGGIRACTFHHMKNDSPLMPSELVVIDTGAEVNQYAADITRTVVNGEPTDRQRAVFDAVRDAQEYAINLLKPGINFREWDDDWRKYVGKKLIDLGLITSADEVSIAKYYPHYSHFLGLDVHDAGDYGRVFEPGMVLTCEPGIYIPEEAIGVRIEDDILITENGCKVLSSKLPRTLTSLTANG